MITPGEWYYNKDAAMLMSTHPDGRGNPTVIADLRIGPNTIDDGEFIEQAVRHLRAVLDLCDELTKDNTDD
jgi:hypothetical protein